MADPSGALRRIDAALARIEAAAARPAAGPAGSAGEAEQLRAALRAALTQVDQLIAQLEGTGQ